MVSGPAIMGWGQQRTTLQTADGIAILGVQTTDNGNGTYHYEYALMNMDFDRKLDSFSLPLAPGVQITNVGFRDIDSNPDNDWTASVEDDVIRWETTDNPLDWGTLYNFRFDANVAPVASRATLGIFEDGPTTELPADILGVVAAGDLPTSTPTVPPGASPTATATIPAGTTPSPTATRPAASPTATQPAASPTATRTVPSATATVPAPTATGTATAPPNVEPTSTATVPVPTSTPSAQAPQISGSLQPGQTRIVGTCEPGADLRISIIPASGGSPEQYFASCTAEGHIAGANGLELIEPLAAGDTVEVEDTTHGLMTEAKVQTVLGESGVLVISLFVGAVLLATVRRRQRA